MPSTDTPTPYREAAARGRPKSAIATGGRCRHCSSRSITTEKRVRVAFPHPRGWDQICEAHPSEVQLRSYEKNEAVAEVPLFASRLRQESGADWTEGGGAS